MWYQKSLKFTIPLLAGLTAIIHLAYAQSVDDWRKATQNSGAEFKLVQSYNGTTPGAGNKLPKVEELKSLDGSYITWPGFMMNQDGSSRIFLQTTRPLEYKEKKNKNKITVTFKKTKIFLSNNRNPLITSHFNTPLKRAYLKKRRKNAELVLQLKKDAEINITQVQVEDGYNYIFIDFPPGEYPVDDTTSPRPNFSGGGDADNQSDGQIQDQESPFQQ